MCRITTSISRLEYTLLEEFDGHWTGELSSSALATAVAVFALDRVDRERYKDIIAAGVRWLQSDINEDGGWGDCPLSQSNLSTTLLVWSALAGHDETFADRAALWITKEVGSLNASDIVEAVLAFYHDDRTFSAPILFMSALAGRLGGHPFSYVPQLPFELAALPHAVFRFLRLPVVSYAVPALIAIGMGRYFATKRHGLRGFLKNRMMRILGSIQPANGGFLEAAPLTAFVVLGLVTAGQKEHKVVLSAVDFLLKNQRPDGSWPIDSNLATWVSTMAIDALRPRANTTWAISTTDRRSLQKWLLNQQFTEEHQFTHAAPGGWAWTDLPGAVPDADDTSGALVALHTLPSDDPDVLAHAERGCSWLLGIQNRDGGIATFCKGWGRLPFDRSCPDITAHAIRAWALWRSQLSKDLQRTIDTALKRALHYLSKVQRSDGAWIPLWFGNQCSKDHSNPVYGTTKVILGLQALRDQEGDHEGLAELLQSGSRWLEKNQNWDGGWGESLAGGSSIEETALALNALASISHQSSTAAGDAPNTGEICGLAKDADLIILKRGAQWLVERLPEGAQAEPIGLYFASLWYSERLYPLVFSLAALKSVQQRLDAETTQMLEVTS